MVLSFSLFWFLEVVREMRERKTNTKQFNQSFFLERKKEVFSLLVFVVNQEFGERKKKAHISKCRGCVRLRYDVFPEFKTFFMRRKHERCHVECENSFFKVCVVFLATEGRK